ncbi:P-loop containing nucleoside triphosphate hydrolase protein [Pavlovales sp. CCMP2436]|nr:P-loop containing nucleoside triphosphate hydrolase protein [Pavlovales sp. CCMP2436]
MADASGAERAAIEEVRVVVGAGESDLHLLRLLRSAGQDVTRAINLFFERQTPEATGSQPQQPGRTHPEPARAAASTPPASASRKRPAEATSPAAPLAQRPHASAAPVSAVAPPPQQQPTRRASLADAQLRAKPLAERMRPRALDELLGQAEAINQLLQRAIETDEIPSLLLWGPPGCGKTSFAHVISQLTRRTFRSISAAKANVEAVRAELSRAESTLKLTGTRSILFVDEIHRFSKVFFFFEIAVVSASSMIEMRTTIK